jgi:hypothetical protein
MCLGHMLGRISTVVAVIALVGALGAPAQAPRVDHVWLSLGSARLGDGWALTTSVTSGEFDTVTGKEILGVTLSRARSGGRARELHALRAHVTRPSVSFDGRAGRWRRAGGSVVVDMAIRATGKALDVSADESLPFACRGSFARVAVELTGTFAVRTGTRTFRTIELRRLRGVVTFNRGGPVECGQSVPPRCESSAVLSASSASSAGVDALSIDRRLRTLVLQFTRRAWSHVLDIPRVDALEGEPSRMVVRAPAALPVTGRAVFEAVRTTESVDVGCRTQTTEGAWTGSLRAAFSAWGIHTFGATPTRGVSAFYRESAPE